LAHTAGLLREVQNWIGGDSLSPRDAEFVPPPPKEVAPLLEDLCRFLDRRKLLPAFRAAVAHAQFATIHPFAAGNGRVGRALIHVVLRQRGLVVQVLPPLLLTLGRRGKAYVRGLTAFRVGDLEDWLVLFATSLAESVDDARRLAVAIGARQARWREHAGHPRSDSAAAAIIDLLPQHPMVTTTGAAGGDRPVEARRQRDRRTTGDGWRADADRCHRARDRSVCWHTSPRPSGRWPSGRERRGPSADVRGGAAL